MYPITAFRKRSSAYMGSESRSADSPGSHPVLRVSKPELDGRLDGNSLRFALGLSAGNGAPCLPSDLGDDAFLLVFR